MCSVSYNGNFLDDSSDIQNYQLTPFLCGSTLGSALLAAHGWGSTLECISIGRGMLIKCIKRLYLQSQEYMLLDVKLDCRVLL